LKNLVDEDCQITLKAMKLALEDEFANEGLQVSIPTISRCLDDFNYSFKRVTRVTERAGAADLVEQHAEYGAWLLQQVIDGKQLIYLDESGFKVLNFGCQVFHIIRCQCEEITVGARGERKQ
jgi:hypothetical protein